jgi:hypothetical protein
MIMEDELFWEECKRMTDVAKVIYTMPDCSMRQNYVNEFLHGTDNFIRILTEIIEASHENAALRKICEQTRHGFLRHRKYWTTKTVEN